MTKLWHKIIAYIIGISALGAVAIDTTIQTQSEVSDIIAQKQELCLQETGHYCQFTKGRKNPSNQTKDWNNVFGNKIKKHDYEIVIDVHEDSQKKWYTVRYIEPVVIVPVTNSTSTNHE